MLNYDYRIIESKWQDIWKQNSQYILDTEKNQKKYYCLVMFPYPSGKIHMGHARNYCIGDAIARYKRMQGFNVFHPLGWDAFGLPAENAAIKHNVHPADWTDNNIKEMKSDIQNLGIHYHWDNELKTCDPQYYRWNQWFFIKMFENNLVYKKESSVNWCITCDTVLANEQVQEQKCWRCEQENYNKRITTMVH